MDGIPETEKCLFILRQAQDERAFFRPDWH